MLLLGLLAVIQVYTMRRAKKAETQDHKVIRMEKALDMAYYPAAVLANIHIESQSYGLFTFVVGIKKEGRI